VFPIFSRMRMLRKWGGTVDVTPDRSPIIAKTPVPGLYVNCGWGTGGFKATPGSANVFAHTVARDEPHPINAPYTMERFATGRLIDEAAARPWPTEGDRRCFSSPARTARPRGPRSSSPTRARPTAPDPPIPRP
jgi:hypothetical protein